MRQIQLFLVPAPGAKPEFLATLETTTSVASSTSAATANVSAAATADNSDVDPLAHIRNPQVVLEGYTRDAWAWKPHACWKTVLVRSVDGRNKIPGFLGYLKERQKSAYARIGGTPSIDGSPASSTSLLCVTYIQPKSATERNAAFQCKISWDATRIPNCPLVLLEGKNERKIGASSLSTRRPRTTDPPPGAIAKSKVNGGGMLGNLLAGQARTMKQYRNALPVKKPISSATTKNDTATTSSQSNNKSKTSQDVLNAFRSNLELKFLDFDISNDNCLQIPVSLAEQTKQIVHHQEDEKAQVTMEVLKYIVYEQAEEVNDEWVVHKEPSEFMDEIVMSVYKEAPPDVLEDV